MIETYRLTLTALVSETTDGREMSLPQADDNLAEFLSQDTPARTAVIAALRQLYGSAVADSAFVVKLESVHLEPTTKEV